MKNYLLLACCLLFVGCVSQKPFFFAAKYQNEPVEVSVGVFYDDFEEADVRRVVSEAAEKFYQKTNIRPIVEYCKKVDWESREMTAMSEQVVVLQASGLAPTWWNLMIYKKTPLEWCLMFIIGNVEGAAEAEKNGGGRWMFVNRLSTSLIIHEMYHLGYGIENSTQPRR